MHLHPTVPLVVFLARASAQVHRMEFADSSSPSMRSLAAECPATAEMPKCAISCIDTAASSNGCPTASDLTCQCNNWAAIQQAAAPCVIAACAAKAPDVLSIASEICSQCAGVPVAQTMNGAANLQWAAAQPTGKASVRRSQEGQLRDWEDLWVDEEGKGWVTLPRRAVVGAVAKETGRPVVPREVLEQDRDRKMLAWADRKPLGPIDVNSLDLSETGPELPDFGSGKSTDPKEPDFGTDGALSFHSEGLELPDFGSDESQGPELPGFGSEKSKGHELADFGGEPTELHPCWPAGYRGSGSLRSCDDLPDHDGDNLGGAEEKDFEQTRSRTWKRKTDLVYEKEEQERLRQLKDMKEQEKQGEQMKWTW
ncbi:hypothetical protein QC763_311280 [Podospora pseudopauciseta]|uniref:CFEM domain-containing protein n=1 Tax=Podospora pseudopauciseta TaxID=2093780 RepID=A0ABR0HIA2_9PEZI|nr:hypothetical protein QC763_311280 [Podospora pseudopauciseta]